MQLRDALSQIAEIRQQMARGQVFRGYRSATTAFSAAVAGAAGAAQRLALPEARATPLSFVLLWVAAAVICLVATGVEMVIRTRRSQSVLQKQLTLLAVELFVPSVVAGALVTWAFCDFLREEAWMLPGLWMILFSMGMFASARLLPRSLFVVAGFYLIAGVVTLVMSRGADSSWRYAPWPMVLTFGLGQLAAAGVLYVKLERNHG